MHSFFGPTGLTSLPRLEAKPKPSSVELKPPKWTRLDVSELGTAAPLPAAFRYDSPDDDDIERLLQEEMATAMLLSEETRERKQEQEQEQEQEHEKEQEKEQEHKNDSAVQRPAVARYVISIAGTPTPPGASPIAGPSNYNKAFSFEDKNSKATIMTTATQVTAAVPMGPLFFPRGSSSVTPVNSVPQRGWESPIKRKFSEIMDSQEPNSLISEPSAHHPSQVQTQASITPDPGVEPSSGKRAKPIQPELQSPPRTALPEIAVPTPPRIRQSQVPIPIGSPRKPIDLTVSPSRTTPTKRKNAPLVAVEDAGEGTDDAPGFEDYDPLSDVEEIHELRRRPTRSHCPSEPAKPGLSTQPPPILQPEGQSMAYQIALAARIPTRSKRRPYLSRNARDFLGHIGSWEGFREFGLLLALDFC